MDQTDHLISNCTKRVPNFNTAEQTLLLELVKKYRHIVESKKPNLITWKQKDTTWCKIQEEFNERNNIFRDVRALRCKYENLKKTAKKKLAEEKMRCRGTDGCPKIETFITGFDEQARDLIHTQVVGLLSEFDCDADSQQYRVGETPDHSLMGEETDSIDTKDFSLTFDETIVEAPSIHPPVRFADSVEKTIHQQSRVGAIPDHTLMREETESIDTKDFSLTFDETTVEAQSIHPPVCFADSGEKTPSQSIKENQGSSWSRRKKGAAAQWEEVGFLKAELIKLQTACLKEEHAAKMMKHELEIESLRCLKEENEIKRKKHEIEIESLRLDILLKKKELQIKSQF